MVNQKYLHAITLGANAIKALEEDFKNGKSVKTIFCKVKLHAPKGYMISTATKMKFLGLTPHGDDCSKMLWVLHKSPLSGVYEFFPYCGGRNPVHTDLEGKRKIFGK